MKKATAIIMILALACVSLAACANPDANSGAKTNNAAKTDTTQSTEVAADEQATESDTVTDALDKVETPAETSPDTESAAAVQSIVGSWIDRKDNWVYARMIFTEDGQMINEDGFRGTFIAAGDLVNVTLGEGTNAYKAEFSLDGDTLYYEGDDGENTFVKTSVDGEGIVGTWTGDAPFEKSPDGSSKEYRFFEDGTCEYIATTLFTYKDLGGGEIEVTGNGAAVFSYEIDGDKLTMYIGDGTAYAVLTREN